MVSELGDVRPSLLDSAASQDTEHEGSPFESSSRALSNDVACALIKLCGIGAPKRNPPFAPMYIITVHCYS